MTPTLLDTDTLTLLHKHHPQVSLNAAAYISQFKQLTLTEFSSIALSEGLAVATHNVSHFTRINSVQVVDWTV